MPETGDFADDEAAPSLAAGTLVGGKYRIERLIGQGGMGSVWAASHVSLGQQVAVKLIAKRFAASREARHRFDLEAKAVAQLRSRYVVQVFDHGEMEDGTPYIVMEYLEGSPLDQRLAERPLTPAEALPIVTQIARALARAHALGIVHRDLKPENVFLATSPDGDGETAKVLDFGIAKMKRAEEVGSSTKTGAVLGTPLYMSPEQARALKSVDHRTDLYSLGMVTFTMLTGQPAFTGESLADLLVAICTADLPSLSAVAPWISSSVSAWFDRACARDPAARFQSAEELAEAFGRAVAGQAPPPVAEITLRGGTAVVPASTPATHLSTGGGSALRGPISSVVDAGTSAPFSITEESIPKRPLGWPLFVGFGILAVLVVVFLSMRSGSNKVPDVAIVPAATAPPAPSLAPVPVPKPPEPAVPAAPASPPSPEVVPALRAKPTAATTVSKATPTAPAPKRAVATPPPAAPVSAPAPKPASKNVDLGF